MKAIIGRNNTRKSPSIDTMYYVHASPKVKHQDCESKSLSQEFQSQISRRNRMKLPFVPLKGLCDLFDFHFYPTLSLS